MKHNCMDNRNALYGRVPHPFAGGSEGGGKPPLAYRQSPPFFSYLRSFRKIVSSLSWPVETMTIGTLSRS